MTDPASPAIANVPGMGDDLDPANRSLADALRRSFAVLKFIMLVLVVLYFLSGWFSVKSDEVGLILRFGRIVGADTPDTASAVHPPNWYWSWPYPIDQWVTLPTSERELRVDFMFELSDEERTGGISGYRSNQLSPARDDYLITGDVNILHAALVFKYRITDPVAYLRNVSPKPDPAAGPKSERSKRYPEYTLMTELARTSVIEAAASRKALDIRGIGQDEFLHTVATHLSGKLKNLESQGLSLGISIDTSTGVLAPKTGGIEGILPPRQTQQAFEGVDKAQATKVAIITHASSVAQSLLLNTAGPDYEKLAEATSAEFELLSKLSEAEKKSSPETASLRQKLDEHARRTEALLLAATGDVQDIIKKAQIKRDQTIKEAGGDHAQFVSLLPEYLRNPEIFLSRFTAETFARVLDNDNIAKIWVTPGERRIWLQIPRSAPVTETEEAKQKKQPRGLIPEGSEYRPSIEVQ